MAASTHMPIAMDSSTLLEPVAIAGASREALAFDDVYRAHFAFVWRSARRLGVRDSSLDDVVQEIFVIVHRRLAAFEGRSSMRTWLFGIAIRVVRDHRRAVKRKQPQGEPIDPDTLPASAGPDAEKAEAVRVLHALLDELQDERREIFVMAELEQMAMPEIAEALGLNLNTAYGRLRAARLDFEQALARHRARDEWRLR